MRVYMHLIEHDGTRITRALEANLDEFAGNREEVRKYAHKEFQAVRTLYVVQGGKQ
jgi:hypothetical protein